MADPVIRSMGGIKGVLVRTLLDCLEAGYSIDDFVKDFPSVRREQVVKLLREAGERLDLSLLRRAQFVKGLAGGDSGAEGIDLVTKPDISSWRSTQRSMRALMISCIAPLKPGNRPSSS